MKIFDTKAQETKYNVLREVAVQTWRGNDIFAEFKEFNEIARKVIPKNAPPQTCCIHKDRAVVEERVRLAIGGSAYNKNVVQVIDIACDECPEAGYVITDLCRGCLAHSCMDACRKSRNPGKCKDDKGAAIKAVYRFWFPRSRKVILSVLATI